MASLSIASVPPSIAGSPLRSSPVGSPAVTWMREDSRSGKGSACGSQARSMALLGEDISKNTSDR